MVYIKKESNICYGVRWLDNCIIDGIGWFQYSEKLSNKPLYNRVKVELKKKLRLLKADPNMNIKGPPSELRHVTRLMNTYLQGNNNDEQ